MITLCIDEGNSRLKYGLFEHDELIESGTDLQKIKTTSVSRAIISTVVSPSFAQKWCAEQNIPVHLLSHKSKLPFSIIYETPETLGNDRIAAVAGSLLLFPKQNYLIIIAGTCITFNFVNADNEFTGGAISPGFAMRLAAMNHFTSKLPAEHWDGISLPELIGSNTKNALLSGAVNGTLQEINGIINEYKSRYPDLKVIVSGGDAAFLVSQLKNNIFARQQLLLEGLNYILKNNDTK